jgi:hypothetical protein
MCQKRIEGSNPSDSAIDVIAELLRRSGGLRKAPSHGALSFLASRDIGCQACH